MFLDATTNIVFGSIGWVDHVALWSFDPTRGQERRFAIEGASYVSVREHGPGLVLLSHHGLGVISIRACSSPDIDLATLHAEPSGYRFSGDSALWGRSLALFVEGAAGRIELGLIDGPAETFRLLDLGWFNADKYDLGYQGLVDCLAMREAGVVVVSVQRSSELVLIDVDSGLKVSAIALADRGGNPRLTRLSGNRFVASDYDLINVVDAQSEAICSSPVLQPPSPPNTRQFIGDYAVRGDACAVAHPFSGDVLLLDINGFATKNRVEVGGQPLEISFTSETAFVTRDWKTGMVRTGEFSG